MKFFNNVRLYIKDVDTGLLCVKFICKYCGKEMDEPYSYYIPCTSNLCKYHETTFICCDCYEKEKSNVGDVF